MAVQNMSVSGKENWIEIEANFKGTLAEKTTVFSNRNATRAVFVRDPIARFASAFLMLCESGLTHENCPLQTNFSKALTMKAAVEWASETDLWSANTHWRPQSAMCELRSRIEEYNIIGLYSKEHFAEDSACVLETAGLSEYTAYWETQIDSRNTFSSGTSAEETALLQRLFTREGANSLFTSYKDDYATFKFPLPKWIEGATGELYEADLRTHQ